MHKDVKIGVVVGIVLAAGVVGYIIFAGSPRPANDAITDEVIQSDQINVPVTRADEPELPSKSLESELADLIIPRMQTPITAPAPDAAVITIDLPEPTVIIPKLATQPEPSAPLMDEIEVIELVADISARTPQGPQTYIVAAEDTRGYWGIAEKVYGQGKHYELIARANPTVNPSELRPGQKLTLPSLPSAASLAGRGKIYVVQEGDKLWKIAKKQYGRGDYWYLIDQANPSIRPGSVIRPGQKLIIPPLPSRAIKPASSAGISTGKITRALTSRKTYVVKAGDSFWTIAQANYGQGKYESLIAKANPSVASRKLKPGQKLILPPKPAINPSPVKSANSAGSSAGARDDRPSFDNYKDY